jgi:perosamine synthetase
MTSKCEIAFSKFIGSQYSIAFVNGTATLHIALEALGIGEGDEVIVPPLTMSSTCFAVLQANATPIFADVDIETFQISASSIKSKLTEKTKAVITVALYGGSPDYNSILNAIGKIPLIEDNAQAIGSTYDGKQLGSFGTFSSYSFQSSKHLTSGEGGMLCTNNSPLAEQARVLQSLGYQSVTAQKSKIDKAQLQNPNYNRHVSMGWNYRMPEIVGAVVLGQVLRANQLLSTRLKAARGIEAVVSECDWLQPQGIYKNSTHSYWAYPVVLDIGKIPWDLFYQKFKEFGGKGFYAAWKLNYKEKAFLNGSFNGREKYINKDILLNYRDLQLPNAEYLQQRIIAFRTNEWERKSLKSQVNTLRRVINFFK